MIALSGHSSVVLYLARLFLFVREAGANKGQRVESIQKWCGGVVGESWCAYWVTMILDLAFAGASPIPRQGGVQAIRELAQKNGWIVTVPTPGDLFVYVNTANHAHHIGFFTNGSATAPAGIAGNTSVDGASSNGDRVAEHVLRPGDGTIEYIAYPRGD